MFSCFVIEIFDSEARFGSSVKIYFENPSSWTILAMFQPILELIPGFSVKNWLKMFEKFCANFILKFFEFFPKKNISAQPTARKKLKTVFV